MRSLPSKHFYFCRSLSVPGTDSSRSPEPAGLQRTSVRSALTAGWSSLPASTSLCLTAVRQLPASCRMPIAYFANMFYASFEERFSFYAVVLGVSGDFSLHLTRPRRTKLDVLLHFQHAVLSALCCNAERAYPHARGGPSIGITSQLRKYHGKVYGRSKISKLRTIS